MLNLLQKTLKSSKVFIYINFNTQSKCVLKKSRIRGSNRYNAILSLVFHLDIMGRWKPVPMMTTRGHQGTLQFIWNDELSLWFRMERDCFKISTITVV